MSERSTTTTTLGIVDRESGLPFLLTAAEAAALLRTSKKSIYAMIERGQLPGVIRIGRRVLVRRDDLLEWLGSRAPSLKGHQR